MIAYCIRDYKTGKVYLPHSMIFWPQRKTAEEALRLCFVTEESRKSKEILRVKIIFGIDQNLKPEETENDL